MKLTAYRRRDGLVIDKQADDWIIIHSPGDQKGIALDPLIFAIWSATEGQALDDLARSLHISIYLASCGLATLQRAGLLQSGPSAAPSSSTYTTVEIAKNSAAAFVLHHHPQADLDACLDSLRKQRESEISEIVVVAAQPSLLEVENVHLMQRDDASWSCALSEWLDQVEVEAVLLLDSGITLMPGALSEMAHALKLRDDIAAVAPRVMWERWPSFVVSAGERGEANDGVSYTGHLDVGQFKRWQGVHSMHPSGGLLRREVLQKVIISSKAAPEQRMRAWAYQTRLQGYHILAALQAVAHGPWPDDLPHDYDALTLYKGMPALTLENVRGLYSHYAAITPLSLSRDTEAELWQYTSYAFADASEIVCGDGDDPLRPLQPALPEPTPLRALPGKAWRILRQHGLGVMAREVCQYIRWKAGG
ncbi:MAG TPA: glycosyltransferase family 2 protein [Chloroflexi bacterium]|nr:glycosyltransferase family 2 protein [Chloroflexota bacterium]